MDRLKIFQIIISFIALVVIARFFYWVFLSNLASHLDTLTQEGEIPAPRGEIFASDGFPLVANQEAFLLYAQPHKVKDPEAVSKDLAPLLVSEKYATFEAQLSEKQQKQKEQDIKTAQDEVKNKLNNQNLFWIQLARKIPLHIVEAINSLKVEGLGFERDEKRFYPEASMSAQLLGFVASDKLGQDTGYFGLEGYYDRRLKGKPGRLGQESDPLGLPILVGRYRPLAPKKGASLYLSIDRVVQFMVEEKLRKAVENYGAKSGTVIVADPKTANIIAMATYPTYLPAARASYSQDLYKNPAVADTFEPGSTFKLITMAAALDLSVVKPDTPCDLCNGPRKIGGFEISTWNKKYYPNSTMTEIIQHSDNVGMTLVAEKLGIERFYDYIAKFGFGKLTGVDLQEESAGSIRDRGQWREIDLATASFGQGIAVTPIQMIQAVTTIASGGRLTAPRVVQKIEDDNHQEVLKSADYIRVISPKTAAQITEMMVNAVENGEAKAFVPRGHKIAGKTGTAQIPVAGHYDPERTIASFVGFAPAYDPKFVMLVLINQPQSSPFGSETAAPTFFDIAKDLFNYFGIVPSP